jgi:hypothetical protein
MSSLPVHLAIEDELSEAVLRRLLAETNRGYTIGTAYGRSGYGYLRKTIGGWNHAAKGVPFVVLTDEDPPFLSTAVVAVAVLCNT